MFKQILKFLYHERVEIPMIVISIIPLFFYNHTYSQSIYNALFIYFSIDFIRRLYLGEYHRSKSLLITDILGLISFIGIFQLLVLFRLARVIKLLLKVKGVRFMIKIYKNHISTIRSLILVSLSFMLLSSLILFNVEPETFDYNYLNALYWSGITLTTVGYGDVYPVTMIGKFIGMAISFIGIGIIALPTGFIAGEFMNELNIEREKRRLKKHHRKGDL